MPTGNSLYHRRPGRFAGEEFRALVGKLKKLAGEHGYTQKQIASELGVSPSAVDKWSAGYPQMAGRETIERLKKFLLNFEAPPPRLEQKSAGVSPDYQHCRSASRGLG